jgi:hypothetical protein
MSALLTAGTLTAHTPTLRRSNATWRSISLAVTTRPQADTLLGPLTGKHPKVKGLQAEDTGSVLLSISSAQVNQDLHDPSMRLSFRAAPDPSLAPPIGDISLMVTGDAARRILATKEAPAVTINLEDSVTLTPRQSRWVDTRDPRPWQRRLSRRPLPLPASWR